MSETWKTYPPEKYLEEAGRLIHFNAKTVNSNTALVGIRLGPEAALDLPYISLRTVLGGGFPFPLDYAEGGAAKAGIMKQINQVLADASEAAAGPEEKAAIWEGVRAARATGYSTGTGQVDHRLRQVLVPKEDAPGGYVSMTPITSGSLCALFFDSEKGLVHRHNAAVKAETEERRRLRGVEGRAAEVPHRETEEPRRRLRQAEFGIGGSNPQNVGSLVRFMQRPLMVEAPGASGSVRAAFALYYKGIEIDVHAAGPFRQAVEAYAALLQRALPVSDEPARTNLPMRQHEEQLAQRIAQTVLDLAAEARGTLLTFARLLPQEELVPQCNPPRYALVSPKVQPPELRGLLDPALRHRCEHWPRQMARLTVERLLAADKEGKKLLLLDKQARIAVEGLLEEVYR